eukprot:12659169-Alexandrium_andersonii.AAC.1
MKFARGVPVVRESGFQVRGDGLGPLEAEVLEGLGDVGLGKLRDDVCALVNEVPADEADCLAWAEFPD